MPGAVPGQIRQVNDALKVSALTMFPVQWRKQTLD